MWVSLWQRPYKTYVVHTAEAQCENFMANVENEAAAFHQRALEVIGGGKKVVLFKALLDP